MSSLPGVGVGGDRGTRGIGAGQGRGGLARASSNHSPPPPSRSSLYGPSVKRIAVEMMSDSGVGMGIGGGIGIGRRGSSRKFEEFSLSGDSNEESEEQGRFEEGRRSGEAVDVEAREGTTDGVQRGEDDGVYPQAPKERRYKTNAIAPLV